MLWYYCCKVCKPILWHSHKWWLWGGQYSNPDFEIGKVHRTPILPILVEQDAGIFTFNKSFAGETIEILIEGIVLYTSIINEGGIIEIPESITGEVELRLIRESITYHAFVNLWFTYDRLIK